ncbi:hypothetical protein [Plantactinospora sonchi]|uniref:Glycosyltransferase RgtA/B/C/D-like domain-containing protein n=1 Tax=Plantactinospora sonchi TaxID=1544735 RepID=A0ABU7RR98_9ACTN
MPHGGRLVRSLDLPGLVALALGTLGVGYRLALILLTVPGSNSDEATFGLVAMHIAEGRAFPVFLYGQHYMGTVESYLAAPLFVLFAPSWTLLRLPLIVLYALFVYLVHRLTRRLYSPWLATFTVGLLALGSERVIRDQITAVGGRPEIKPAVLALLLIALALGQRRVRRRWWAFGLFGVLAGLCVWDDWLVVPYLIAAFGLLVVGCWRALLGWAGLLVAGGFLLGVAPLIVDNLTAPAGQDSVSVLRQVSDGTTVVTTVGERLHGAILVGIPLATGLCPPDRCQPWQMWWGGLYPVLLVAALVLAVVGLVRRTRPPGVPAGRQPGATPSGPGDRPAGWATDRLRYVGQLALLVGAALALAAYARSALAATAPLASARYLSILQISLPAVLWPLWLVARWAGRVAAGPAARVSGVLAATVLTLLTALVLGGTGQLIGEIGTIRAEERQARVLADTLRRADLPRVYGEYWTCNRLVFIAREEVVCAVVGDNLRPGQNRYRPYEAQVRAADRPAFVLAAGGPAEAALHRLLRREGVTATVDAVGQHRIYRPDRTVQPPG